MACEPRTPSEWQLFEPLPFGSQPFHPSHDLHHEQMYQPSANSYTPGPYTVASDVYPSQGQAVRRKQVRATQACNNCRSRKQKCDEQRPCQFCRESNLECQYKDVPPPKQDRTMMQLQDTVNNLHDTINNISGTLRGLVEGFGAWKDNIESRLGVRSAQTGQFMAQSSNHVSPQQNYGWRSSITEHNGSGMSTPVQARFEPRRVSSMKVESPVTRSSMASPLPIHAPNSVKRESIVALPVATSISTPVDGVTVDRELTESSGLQSDHKTPAHQVLADWPSMTEFCVDMNLFKKIKIPDYPMKVEQDRGIIRVWGIGEGMDKDDGAQCPTSPKNNDYNWPSPPTPKDPLWGGLNAPTPSTLGPNLPIDPALLEGGLGPDGQLQLDRDTLDKLHDSFYTNIYILHPFLAPNAIRKMVHDFGFRYGLGSKRFQTHAGIKRKRSSSAFDDSHPPNMNTLPGELIERSLGNAIVLLVLALGKVCAYKRPLPAPQGAQTLNGGGLWGSARSSPRTANNSFRGDFGTETRLKNRDILPGMAYFAAATDILGNQQGANTTGHCQALLLAGIYMGQFARVLESWSWINNACRVCLVLVKSNQANLDREILLDERRARPTFTDKEKFDLNLIKCVYWTCLQLESDILAEMSTLSPTEISKYHDKVSYPSGVYESTARESEYETNPKNLMLYASQIHLRMLLNAVHNDLYGKGGKATGKAVDPNDLSDVAKRAKEQQNMLDQWKMRLPAEMQWNDDELPSTDINTARLRAKYYGASYVILRPYLYLAVHNRREFSPKPATSEWSSQSSSPMTASEAASTPTYDSSSIHRKNQKYIMEPNAELTKLVEVSNRCITHAIKSTIAFDRVGADPNAPYEEFVDMAKDRLIVTNIVGTLHAQFGNMIVLTAVYKSELGEWLRHPKLTTLNMAKLYRRTIHMLELVAPNSPILSVDARILRNIRRQSDFVRL